MILLQIDLPFVTCFAEFLVFGDPVREMVFWQYGKLGALSCSAADVSLGGLVVLFWLERLCDRLAKVMDVHGMVRVTFG